MAITVTELVEYATADNGSSYTTTSYTPTALRGLVACIFATATDHNLTPTVTGNNATWGLEDAASRGAHAMWVFTAWSGSNPTNTGLNVEINPADPATGLIAWVGELSGVDPATADFFVQVKHGAFDAAVNPQVTFDAVAAASSTAIGFLTALLNPAAQTPPTNWTEVMDTGIAAPTAGATVAYYTSFGANNTVNWGSNPSTVSTLTIMEIAEASTGAAVVTLATVAAVAAVPTPAVTAGSPATTTTTVAATTSIETPRVSTVDPTEIRKVVKKFKQWGFVYEGQVLRDREKPW